MCELKLSLESEVFEMDLALLLYPMNKGRVIVISKLDIPLFYDSYYSKNGGTSHGPNCNNKKGLRNLRWKEPRAGIASNTASFATWSKWTLFMSWNANWNSSGQNPIANPKSIVGGHIQKDYNWVA